MAQGGLIVAQGGLTILNRQGNLVLIIRKSHTVEPQYAELSREWKNGGSS